MYEQNNRRLTNNNTHEIVNEQLVAFKRAINTALESPVKHSKERKQGSNARSNSYVQQTIQLDSFIKELQQAVLQHNTGESLWYTVNNIIQKKMPNLVSINKLTFGMFSSDDPCTILAIDLNRIIKYHYSLNELKQSDQAVAAMATAAIVMEEVPEELENDLPSQQQLASIQNMLNQVASQLGNVTSSTNQVKKESKNVELKPLSINQNNDGDKVKVTAKLQKVGDSYVIRTAKSPSVNRVEEKTIDSNNADADYDLSDESDSDNEIQDSSWEDVYIPDRTNTGTVDNYFSRMLSKMSAKSNNPNEDANRVIEKLDEEISSEDEEEREKLYVKPDNEYRHSSDEEFSSDEDEEIVIKRNTFDNRIAFVTDKNNEQKKIYDNSSTATTNVKQKVDSKAIQVDEKLADNEEIQSGKGFNSESEYLDEIKRDLQTTKNKKNIFRDNLSKLVYSFEKNNSSIAGTNIQQKVDSKAVQVNEEADSLSDSLSEDEEFEFFPRDENYDKIENFLALGKARALINQPQKVIAQAKINSELDEEFSSDNEEEEENIFRKENIKLKFFNLNRKTEELAAQTTILTERVDKVEVKVEQQDEKIEKLKDAVYEQKSDILVTTAHIQLLKSKNNNNVGKAVTLEEESKQLNYKIEVAEEDSENWRKKFHESQLKVNEQEQIILKKKLKLEEYKQKNKIYENQIAINNRQISILADALNQKNNNEHEETITSNQIHELTQKVINETGDNVLHAMEQLPSVLRSDEVRVISSETLVIDDVINNLDKNLKEISIVSVGNNSSGFHKPVKRNPSNLTVSSVNDLVSNVTRG